MIEPNGRKLVNKIIEDRDEIDKIINKNIKRIEITKDVLLDVESISNGVFSPLSGFPSIEEINSILDNWRLKDGTIFSIPPLFHVNQDDYDNVNIGEEIILTYEKKPIGTIKVDGKSEFDKSKFIQEIFRTTDLKHPGVAHINNINNHIITGEVNTFGRLNYFFNDHSLTPLETREEFEKRGWKNISIFSTTNVPHRAHEHLHRIALEITDGLFIHTLDLLSNQGYAKFNPEIIREGYLALINNYYPKERVLFTSFPFLARSAGPREMILQAVIRKNFGCSHFIVGRDHAGFGNVYGKYESQEIFKKFPDLDVQPIMINEPRYCKKCGHTVTEKNCGHEDQDHEEISGTIVREKIKNKQEIPDYMMRKEVADVLKKEFTDK